MIHLNFLLSSWRKLSLGALLLLIGQGLLFAQVEMSVAGEMTLYPVFAMVQRFNADAPVLKLNITPKDCVVSYGRDDNFDMGVKKISDGHFEETLPPGIYWIRIENPFFETYIGTYQLDADAGEVSISLRPSYGHLSFESEPAGVEVFMDGSVEPIGETPFTSGRITKGMHSFRLFKENYYAYQMEYEVKSDGSVQSVPHISMKPRFGVVTCVCDDEDATLTVTDATGRVVGQGKSGMRLELGGGGNYKLESSRPSHHSQSIGIQGGTDFEGHELTVSIGAPIPIYGGLYITSAPKRAEIWIDGEIVGRTNWMGKLLKGEHRIELKKKGFFLDPFMVVVPENEKVSVSKTMNEGHRPSSFGTECANCYIVSKPGTFFFYTVIGNSLESVGPVETAEVLWESFGTSQAPSKGDIIKNVSFTPDSSGLSDEEGIITFSTPATLKNGNAVIAAKDEYGDVLWSWHIWVCEGYDPIATAQVYYNNAGTMMDRNLGAISATPGKVGALGLLYQWGRKDPFLGSRERSIIDHKQAVSTIRWPDPVSSTRKNGTVDFAVKNPTTFIKGTKGTQEDWIYSQRDDALWQSTKTIYDPCPPGWKVPKGGPDGIWSQAVGHDISSHDYPYDDSRGGHNFSGKFGEAGTIWYPHTGGLSSDDAGLYNVSGSSHLWSCTPNDDQAYELFLNGKYVYVSDDFYRASGHSVRCMQE
ncbi:MAG: PEGA domain-containing protein [Bacteroidales bacterium]|nr:PEGA domain-containing protein [Bacteroidales bacterium]